MNFGPRKEFTMLCSPKVTRRGYYTAAGYHRHQQVAPATSDRLNENVVGKVESRSASFPKSEVVERGSDTFAYRIGLPVNARLLPKAPPHRPVHDPGGVSQRQAPSPEP